MKISLVDGPYDAQVYEIALDRNGIPELDVINVPRTTTIAEGIIERRSNVPAAPEEFLHYRLKRVADLELIDGCLRDSLTKWHWEYHFEG